MRLHAVCYYRSKSDEWTDEWRNEDYSAMTLVKALKPPSFKSNCNLSSGGIDYRVDDTSAGRNNAMFLSGRCLAAKILQAGYAEAAVIPIPSSSHVDPGADFTGRRLAQSIQNAHASLHAAPILYFDEPMEKSRGGGTRNPYAIQPRLRMVEGELPARAVLIDDVCTTGGHLIAAARFLASRGLLIEDAFVVGRTWRQRPESMFSVAPEELSTASLFDF